MKDRKFLRPSLPSEKVFPFWQMSSLTSLITSVFQSKLLVSSLQRIIMCPSGAGELLSPGMMLGHICAPWMGCLVFPKEEHSSIIRHSDLVHRCVLSLEWTRFRLSVLQGWKFGMLCLLKIFLRQIWRIKKQCCSSVSPLLSWTQFFEVSARLTPSSSERTSVPEGRVSSEF